MRLVYFARVREAVGIDGEDRVLPEHVLTVGDCLDWLKAQDAVYATAFANREKLRFALDQQMVSEGTALDAANELAIFPPVTGG
jgi:molybdopterin synthase sulfur carrier subunit